jgi:hypothetical protein
MGKKGCKYYGTALKTKSYEEDIHLATMKKDNFWFGEEDEVI